MHGKRITTVPIFVGADSFRRIWGRGTNSHPSLTTPANELPITFQLVAFKHDNPEQKCEWPDGLQVEMNGTPVALNKVRIY